MNIRPLPVAQLDASFAEKFWARTIMRDSGCLEWTGPVAAQGRAMVFIAGAQYYASRVAFFLSTGIASWTPGRCHHDAHVIVDGRRLGLLMLDDDLASLLPCLHIGKDGRS